MYHIFKSPLPKLSFLNFRISPRFPLFCSCSWSLTFAFRFETSLVAEIVKNMPLEKDMQPSPVFLPGDFHTQRSLASYSPVCCVCLVAQSCPTVWDPVDCSLPGSSVHGDSPSKTTGVHCHVLLQGIFPTQRLNLSLSYCSHIPYRLSHQGSSRILEWVSFPFSRGSSQPRNRTGVSCIAGLFFTRWATREAQL